MYTWIDYLLIVMMVVNVGLGLMRGLIKEVVSLVALVLALFIAIQFTHPIAGFLSDSAGAGDVINVIARFFHIDIQSQLTFLIFDVSFLVLFVGVFSIGEGIIYFGPIDLVANPIILLFRLLGAGLGFFRGYLFCIIFLLIMTSFPLLVQNNAWNQSIFVPQLLPSAIALAQKIGFPN